MLWHESIDLSLNSDGPTLKILFKAYSPGILILTVFLRILAKNCICSYQNWRSFTIFVKIMIKELLKISIAQAATLNKRVPQKARWTSVIASVNDVTSARILVEPETSFTLRLTLHSLYFTGFEYLIFNWFLRHVTTSARLFPQTLYCIIKSVKVV